MNLFLLLQNGALLSVYFLASCVISWTMTAFALTAGVALLAALHGVRKRAAVYGQGLTQNRRDQYRLVSEFLAGVKVAKSFNAEIKYSKALAGTLDSMRSDYLRFLRISSTANLAVQSTSAAVLAFFVYIALERLELSLPKIVVLVFIFMRVTPRITGCQSYMQEILVNIPAFYAMESLRLRCDTERECAVGSNGAHLTLRRGLEVENVTFRYDREKGENVVEELSFKIPAGLVTAIVGPSGSGKSTIADMLIGLLEPTAGVISVDGVALNEGNRRAWRENVGYVPQDVFLLNDTIEANLRLAAPTASDNDMWEVLVAANADAFVGLLPEKLCTVLGDRGSRLSGGERQRIALARALLRRPRLLLLDEATSALDWESQRLIASAIAKLRGSTTVVTIAHRPSMISLADWIVSMEAGRIVETGFLQELLQVDEGRLSRLVAGEGTFEIDRTMNE